MKTFYSILAGLALLVLTIGGLAAYGTLFKKPQEKKEVEVKPTPVNVVNASQGDVILKVETQGTVEPRTETALMPEVSGRIVSVSPKFHNGGIFEAGEVILQIDPSDYEAAIVEAQANLANFKLLLAQEEARAEQARKDWGALGVDRGEPAPLVMRVPQLEKARSELAWAESLLETAQRNLERTRIKAPYMCLVREKHADIGQNVTPGNQLATVFAIDRAEIRLPLTDDDLLAIDLPYFFNESPERPGPMVTFRSVIGGLEREWQGRIVRTEGRVDNRSRFVYAVAEVANPYGYGEGATAQDDVLPMGLFVQAEIQGRTAHNVSRLPRHAIRDRDTLLVVNTDDELEIRKVEVIKADKSEVLIGEGIADGESICLTPLTFVANGMKVKPLREIEEPSGDEPENSKADEKEDIIADSDRLKGEEPEQTESEEDEEACTVSTAAIAQKTPQAQEPQKMAVEEEAAAKGTEG